ncbi:phosphatidylglycerophosphatase A [Moraxella osloensis]|jgi:phosphatidylglycerophosphatase A|uniref:Phosphatidylglycerophosphatase A n=1 Tax=Faucicola osloensis TaxID=34062 RepID=A0A0X8K760_FAUOS|nr:MULTISPECIES: phosphatidylglycerophosphatase A [Moraxella]GGL98638.1 phosphatidylglycerophosphatase A [Streptomyces cinereus]AME01755.1 phosphatidylglycerophosphatase [Moraxella osloensis]OBX53933.1 phosphatidylglycerophosphatase A [Moraxella osloensis]OBX55524.1 phosphatidylglycerophosphatase A [Moraxella osloensis]PAL14994.1 phosphatidylglycerophosphatase A [Moraxella osloensis]
MTQLHKPDVRKANVCPPCPPTASVWEKLIYWLGIGLGSGLPKRAAGTWGTVGGLVVAIPMLWLGFWGFLAVTVVGALVGSYICGKTSDLMGVHDDPHIVWDEWVGMWVSLLPILWLHFYDDALLQGHQLSLLLLYFAAFVAFRFFDILKPFPIKWVDKNVSGGFGILIDDILAGLMAGVVLIVFVSVLVTYV